MRYSEILNESFSGNVEGVSRIGPVTFDQRYGIGNVPDNQNVAYLGFGVIMTPRQFLRLAATRDFNAGSNLAGLCDALRDGKAFASPWLDLVINSKNPDAPARVRGHEGRTRCKAIEMVFGPRTPILVHVFLSGGLRARHLSLDQIAGMRDHLIPEDQTRAILGPHFSNEVFWNGWKTLPPDHEDTRTSKRITESIRIAGKITRS